MDIFVNKGIKVEKGLSPEELNEIEERYSVKFPNALRLFYISGLPVSKGFYNWRDASRENIEYIKNAIADPFEEFRENAEAVYWNDEWGEKPESSEEIGAYVLGKLSEAPRLIPIYSHRYVPMGVSDNPPVISVYGVDIIYYGEDLSDYLQIEFGLKKQEDINFSGIQKIPFWSEVM